MNDDCGVAYSSRLLDHGMSLGGLICKPRARKHDWEREGDRIEKKHRKKIAWAGQSATVEIDWWAAVTHKNMSPEC
jgi:hypothetical protein